MSSNTKSLVGLAALALLAGGLFAYIWFVERHTTSTGELAGRERRLVRTYVRDRVARIEITRGDVRYVLERAPDTDPEDDMVSEEFVVASPVRGPADSDAISALLGQLEWAEARRTLEHVTAAQRTQFGFDRPRVRAVIVVGREPQTVLFGNDVPEGDGVYAMTSARDVAFVVGRDTFEALDHELFHFRSKQLFADWSPETARRIDILHHGARMNATLVDGRYLGPNGVFLSRDAVTGLLRSLDEARITEFVREDGAGLESETTFDFQFGPPPDGGVGASHRVAIGPACGSEGARLVRVDSGGLVCAAVAAVSTALDAELRETRLLPVGPQDVSRIRLADGDVELILERGTDDFSFRYTRGAPSEAPATGRVPTAAIERWLGLVAEQRVTFAESELPRAQGPNATLTWEGGSAAFTFHGIGGAEVAVSRDGETGVHLRAPGVAPFLFAEPRLRTLPTRLVDADESRATALTITRPGFPPEELTRGESGWRVRTPDIAADRLLTEAVLRRLVTLDATARVPAGAFPAAPAAIGIELFARGDGGGETRVRLDVTETATNTTLVRTDAGAVAIVDAALRRDVLESLSDRTLLDIERDAIVGVDVARGPTRFRATRGEAGWTGAPGSISVDSILDAFVQLRAAHVLRFAPRPTSTTATLTFRARSGRTTTIILGTTTTGSPPASTLEAVRNDRAIVYGIAPEVLRALDGPTGADAGQAAPVP